MNYEFVISVTAARTLSVWFKAFWQSHTREMAAPTVALPKQCGAKTCAWVYRMVLVVGVWSKACIVAFKSAAFLVGSLEILVLLSC